MHTDSTPIYYIHTIYKTSINTWKSPHLIRKSLAKEKSEYKTDSHFDVTTKEDAFGKWRLKISNLFRTK